MPNPPPAVTGRAPSLLAGAVLVALVVVATGCLPPASRGSEASEPAAGTSGDPTAALPSAPTGPTPRPSFVPPTPTPAPTFAVYTVASGDNLSTVAEKFGTTPRSIAFWNRSRYPSLDPESDDYSPNLLKLGWTLFLIPNVILTDDEVPPLPS